MAQEAAACAVPVRLGVAQRPVGGLSRIDRVMVADGRSVSLRRSTPANWLRSKPQGWHGDYWLQPETELDDTLTVLRVENAEGRPIGCFYHFACHPDPDFMGYAADLVEDAMGEGFVCGILNGTVGDVDVPFEVPRRGKIREANYAWPGEVMGYAVLETLARAEVEDGGRIDVASEEVFLPLDHRVVALEERAAAEPDPDTLDRTYTGGS